MSTQRDISPAQWHILIALAAGKRLVEHYTDAVTIEGTGDPERVSRSAVRGLLTRNLIGLGRETPFTQEYRLVEAGREYIRNRIGTERVLP